MNESSLGVHEIKLVVKSGPGFGDGCGVAQHADSALNLGQIATRNHSRGLVVDTDLESGWAPIYELDGPLGLDGGDGGVDVLGDDVSAVKQATRHVLTVTGIAFYHLVGRLETSVSDFGDGKLFVVSL